MPITYKQRSDKCCKVEILINSNRLCSAAGRVALLFFAKLKERRAFQVDLLQTDCEVSDNLY
jgi:hypothetical protein